MTGKSRKTHLLGYNSLVALRLSTIPEINRQIRKNKGLQKELAALLQKKTAEAKKEVEDFYNEVTYKSKWQKEGPDAKPRKKSRQESLVKTPEALRRRQEASSDDSEPEEEEEKESSEENQSDNEGSRGASGDEDLWSDRFSSQDRATPPSRTGSKNAEVPAFKRSLQAILDSAVGCGALNQA